MFFCYGYCHGCFSTFDQSCCSEAAGDRGRLWVAERIEVVVTAISSVRTLTSSTRMGLLHIPSHQSCDNIVSKVLFAERLVKANRWGLHGARAGSRRIKNTPRTKKWADQNARRGNTDESPNQVVSPGRNQERGQWARMMTTVKLALLTSGTQWNAEQKEHN